MEQSGRLLEHLFRGIIGYAIVVGVSHTMEGSARGARAEAAQLVADPLRTTLRSSATR